MWDMLRVLVAALAIVSGQPVGIQGRTVKQTAKPVKTDEQDNKTTPPPAAKVQSSQVGPGGKTAPIKDTPAPVKDQGNGAANGVNVTTAQTPGFVTNVYTEASLRAIFSEVQAIAGVQIITDSTVPDQPTTIEFKNEPIDSVVAILAKSGGLQWKKQGGLYLVSTAAPDAPLFNDFVVVRRYTPKSMSVESLLAAMPSKWKDLVSGDKAANVMTVMAAENTADSIVRDLRLIDTPPRQIMVEALMVEVSSNKTDDFNFSWNWQNFGVNSDTTLQYSSTQVTDLAKLKMLISNQKATVRANPRVSAFEGREANFRVGSELYYSLQTANSGTVYNNFGQIQTIKTGVTLKFTAFIDDSGMITLNLDPEVSDAAQYTAQGYPTTTTRTAHTTIRLRDGETFAIGGLVQEFTKQTISKIPILGDIPLLGQIFTTKANSKQKTEVIMMITPHITDSGVGRALDGDRRINTPLLDPKYDMSEAEAKAAAGSSRPVKVIKEAPKVVLPNVDTLNSVVVGPMGARNAFRFDEATLGVNLAGMLPAGASYPADLVALPTTKAEDGKSLQMLVLRDGPGWSGEKIAVRPIGVVVGQSTVNGKAVPMNLPIGVQMNSVSWVNVKSIDDLSPAKRSEIDAFIRSYYPSLNSTYELKEFAGVEKATDILGHAVLRKQKR